MTRLTRITTMMMRLTLASACAPSAPANATDDPSVYVAAIDVLFARDSTLRHVVIAEEPLSLDSASLRQRVAEMAVLDSRDSAAGGASVEYRLSTRPPSAVDLQTKHQGVAAVARQSTLERLHAQADSDFNRAPQRYVTPVPAYWERFHREYAPVRTLVRLSLAAYDRDRRRALVYISYGCDEMCGGSYWVLFERAGAEWRVRQVRQGYVV